MALLRAARRLTVRMAGVQPDTPAAGRTGARLVRRHQVVAEVYDDDLVKFYTEAPRVLDALRELLLVLAKTHTSHEGCCVECGQQAPCRTRSLIDSHLRRAHAPRRRA